MYLGDYAEDYATLTFTFSTRKDTGLPTVLSGSPVISVYKGSSTTPKTSAEAYITLTIDFNSKVGLNHLLIDLSGDAFFATGNDYHVVITTGTVNSISVVGETVATFSIENRFMRGTDGANTDKTGYALSAAGTLAIWHEAVANIVTASTIGKLLKDEITSARMATLTDWINGGRLDLLLDTIQADLDTLTDARGEPAQGAPPVSTTTNEKIDFLFKAWRNRSNQTATLYQLFNDDATTVDHKATVSDNGTTAEKGEVVSGP